VRHVTAILGQAAEAIGNMAVSQSFAQSQGKLEQLLTESNIQRSAFERAQSTEGLERLVLEQSILNIRESLMEGHPR